MKEITVTNQADFDAISSDFDGLIIIQGNWTLRVNKGAPRIVARGSSAPRIVARGSSAPRIEAWESSAPRIEAWESSAPRIEARESSAPRIEAWESSAPSIEARGSSAPRIVARESSAISGSSGQYAIIGVHFNLGAKIEIVGPHVTLVPNPSIETAEAWCEYHGVEISDGIATLYKAVHDDLRSAHGFLYAIGSAPAAPDWDGGKQECGGGLHFSPSPLTALTHDTDATRFLACPVALVDMRAPTTHDSYPDKIKAARIAGPIYEVDRYGQKMEATV